MRIEKFIKRINLIKLLKELGVKNILPLVNDVMASCPFHNDVKPSFGINKRTGVWHCFTCEAVGEGGKGDLISLVARLKKMKYKKAIQYLYRFAGIKKDLIVESKDIVGQIKDIIKGRSNKKEYKKPVTRLYVPKDTNPNFVYGLEYFKNRGIHKDTLQNHNISFCLKGFYRNRAIIPIEDEHGKLLLFEARDITGMNSDKVLYPKGAKKAETLYNINNAKKANSVIIVEGIMDALYLEERGFNTVAVFGVNISNKQEELLNKYFRRVYIAFDGDREGYKAMIQQSKKMALHLSVYIVTLPKNTDPDELDKEEMQKLIDSSVEINSYLSKQLNHKIMD